MNVLPPGHCLAKEARLLNRTNVSPANWQPEDSQTNIEQIRFGKNTLKMNGTQIFLDKFVSQILVQEKLDLMK